MTALLVVWAVAGFAAWFLWVKRLDPWTVPEEPSKRFGRADVVVATLLASLFLLVIAAASTGERVAVSRDLILDNGAVQLCIVLLLLIALVIRGKNPVAMFGLAPGRPVKVAVTGVLCLVATYPIVAVLAALAALGGASPSGEDAMVEFLRNSPAWQDRAVAIGYAVLIAPVAEELIFRGYLHGVVRQFAGRVGSIVSTSILFAAVHPNIPAIPALFALSVGLTLAYERTGSLLAPIAMHFLFNATTVAAVFFFPESLQ